jgi:OFA family oxalate/formate antiporter-like MFS transporter
LNQPASPFVEYREGGRPLIAGTLGVAFGSSSITYNVMPLVLGPVHNEFGWSYAEISLGFVVYGSVAAACATLFGYLADKMGTRHIALGSLVAFAAVFCLFSALKPSLWMYYGIWVAMGLVAIGSSPVIWSRAICLWFVQRRGMALGLMLTGTSFAGLLVPQLTQLAIAAGGWRASFPVAAALTVFVALPVCLLWFREPPHQTDQQVSVPASEPAGVVFRVAVRDPRFWLMLLAVLLFSTAYGGAYIHIGEIVALHGYSSQVAALVIGSAAIGILVGRVVIGLLFDYFWAPAVIFPAMLAGAISCLLLGIDGQQISTLLVGGCLLGLSSGAESDAIAYLVSRYFGMINYSRIYGALFMPYVIGASVSPLIYGIVRDQTGSYQLMLHVATGLFLLSGIVLFCLGRYPVLIGTDAHADCI